MADREVTMLETKEVLRLWLAGVPKKRVARQLGVDPKTVRRYVAAAESAGLSSDAGEAALTDDRFAEILITLRAPPERPRGESWERCESNRAFIEGHLKNRGKRSASGVDVTGRSEPCKDPAPQGR